MLTMVCSCKFFEEMKSQPEIRNYEYLVANSQRHMTRTVYYWYSSEIVTGHKDGLGKIVPGGCCYLITRVI